MGTILSYRFFCALLNLSRCCPFTVVSLQRGSIVSLRPAFPFLPASESYPQADEMTAATLPDSVRPSGFITRIPPCVGYANKVWVGGFQM